MVLSTQQLLLRTMETPSHPPLKNNVSACWAALKIWPLHYIMKCRDHCDHQWSAALFLSWGFFTLLCLGCESFSLYEKGISATQHSDNEFDLHSNNFQSLKFSCLGPSRRMNRPSEFKGFGSERWIFKIFCLQFLSTGVSGQCCLYYFVVVQQRCNLTGK